MQLNQETIDKIAEEVHTKLRNSSHTDFYLDPEEHYNSHMNLNAMYKDWKGVRRAMDKVMLGFMTIGIVVLAGVGAITEFYKGFAEWFKGY